MGNFIRRQAYRTVLVQDITDCDALTIRHSFPVGRYRIIGYYQSRYFKQTAAFTSFSHRVISSNESSGIAKLVLNEDFVFTFVFLRNR